MANKKSKQQVDGVVQTPMMKQYNSFKAQYPGAILLFRVGDFYETFGEDAIRASAILGITLTRRANGAAAYIELAGFPYHSLNTYLPKLVRAGERVAICEQLEDPKQAKTIVKRGVIELVTPGVVLDDSMLTSRENSFLASVYFGRKSVGVAFLDISTGEFYVAEGEVEYIDKLLSNFAPKEVVYQRIAQSRFEEHFGKEYYTYKLDEWVFSEELNYEKLTKQFEVKSLKGFGVEHMREGIVAAGAILYYLEFTEHKQISHISSIARLHEDEYVWIDRFTARNLELFPMGSNPNAVSFSQTIDRTKSPMGSRLLKQWIALPIRDLNGLNDRQDVVAFLVEDGEFNEALGELVSGVSDLERIVSRIATSKVLPRELIQLKYSLDRVVELKHKVTECGNNPLMAIGDRLDPLNIVRERIAKSIYPDPSNQIAKGGVIGSGVSAELDQLRDILMRGKDMIADIQRRESEITGIPSLKVGFNNVFGYYIEVRNTHKDKVPQEWTRKQTLTAAERYITAELKEYEEKILGAEEKIIYIEQVLYNQLIDYLMGFLRPLQSNSLAIAQIDCLNGFATLARERAYVRPELSDGVGLEIRGGRHPVIETLMGVGEQYVPNDLLLDDHTQQIIIITGPNMSGKSALLRQTGLIVLLAQMGSFVPADSAKIGLVDKIFTRVGASDNISQGESTFMVEMLESANILNNISERSLVLLDEIGRGTSTYDGISIAWAMVEYLHNHRGRPKTLFATHYHELNELEEYCSRVKNYNVSVKEIGREIIFLRKLVPGGTEHSFGIHVAKMAGMPSWVVTRAEEMLKILESQKGGGDGKKMTSPKSKASEGIQMSFFQLDDPVLTQIRDEIKGLDINNLTPMEALNKLNEIKKITGL